MDGKLGPQSPEQWAEWFKHNSPTAANIALIQKQAVDNYINAHLNPLNAARAQRIRSALRGTTNELG